jgi:UTRA domain
VAALMSIAQTVGTANVAEWAKLVLSDLQAPVLRVTRLRHDDQARPVALEEVVLPLDRFPGLAPSGDIPDIVELAQRHSLPLGRVAERISIVRATKDVASQSSDCSQVERDEAGPHYRDCRWQASGMASGFRSDDELRIACLLRGSTLLLCDRRASLLPSFGSIPVQPA